MYNTRPVSELEVPYLLTGQIIENKYPVFSLDVSFRIWKHYKMEWNRIFSQSILINCEKV